MRRLIAVIIIACYFVYPACTTQEECENMVGNQYRYRIELIDDDKITSKVRFCDTFYVLYPDTFTTFAYQDCANGKLIYEKFTWKTGSYLAMKL